MATTQSTKPKRATSKVGAQPAKVRKAARAYDAEATRKVILDAATHLLTEKGFTALGINALANAAGVDKQLIYYHFGSLEGVVRAMGGELSLWLGTQLEPVADERYADASTRLMLEYFGALRQNTLVQRLLAWELVEPSTVLAELELARSQAMTQWVQAFRAATLAAPNDVDAPAINALLLAGLHYLALRERSVGSFAGLDLRSAEGVKRIERALTILTKNVYA